MTTTHSISPLFSFHTVTHTHTHTLQLLGFLSFDERNVKTLVKEGGIQIIMKAIAQHAREEDLILRAIKTIDFIAMTDQSYAAIVRKCGGVKLVTKIMSLYAMHEDIQDSGSSALTSMEVPPDSINMNLLDRQ